MLCVTDDDYSDSEVAVHTGQYANPRPHIQADLFRLGRQIQSILMDEPGCTLNLCKLREKYELLYGKPLGKVHQWYGLGVQIDATVAFQINWVIQSWLIVPMHSLSRSPPGYLRCSCPSISYTLTVCSERSPKRDRIASHSSNGQFMQDFSNWQLLERAR